MGLPGVLLVSGGRGPGMLPETLPAPQSSPGKCRGARAEQPRSKGLSLVCGDTGRPVCTRSYLTAWELFLLEW